MGKIEELDPSGKDAHSAGSKLDAGKLMADLVIGDFSNALTAVAEVGTFGAMKYTPKGWETVPNGAQRYADAGIRHYLKRKSGELIDADSGLLHKAHEAWNHLAELELMIKESKKGDFPYA
jgi:hypothetical protein